MAQNETPSYDLIILSRSKTGLQNCLLLAARLEVTTVKTRIQEHVD